MDEIGLNQGLWSSPQIKGFKLSKYLRIKKRNFFDRNILLAGLKLVAGLAQIRKRHKIWWL